MDEPLAYRLTVAALAVLRTLLIYGEAGAAEAWRPALPGWRWRWAPQPSTSSARSTSASVL